MRYCTVDPEILEAVLQDESYDPYYWDDDDLYNYDEDYDLVDDTSFYPWDDDL